MSNIFQHVVRSTNGVVPATAVTPPVDGIESQGLLLDSDGNVYVAFIATSTIAYHAYGLPFDEFGALIVSGEAISYFDQGIAFTAAGAVAISEQGMIDHRDQGVAFTLGGAMITSGAAPVGNPPDQVTMLSLTQQLNALFASWDAANSPDAPVSTYIVEYRLSPAGSWNAISVGNVTNHSIGGLMGNTAYDVRVKAVNDFGEGPYSTIETLTTGSLPEQVTNVQGTPAPTTIDVTWDVPTANPATNSYIVQWKLSSSGTWNNQATVGTNSYQITGLNPSTNYDIRVQGSNIWGTGPFSTPITVQTTASALLLHYDQAGLVGSPNVTQWNNTGTLTDAGYNHQSIVGTASNLTRGTQNGVDVLQSNTGVGLFCGTQGPTIAAPYTIYISGRPFTNTADLRYWFESYFNNVAFRMSNAQHTLNAGTTLAQATGGPFSSVVYALVVNGTSSRMVAQGAINFDVTGDAGSNAFAPRMFTWNNSTTSGQEYNGLVYEMRVYSGAHDSATIASTLSAIRTKYGF